MEMRESCRRSWIVNSASTGMDNKDGDVGGVIKLVRIASSMEVEEKMKGEAAKLQNPFL
ncbi:hypothetical protein CAEBREN_24307 [Caenorhabditis brenneri]|uniref:Uncharacterized protein n=1 Tax=Caenorhabditis brenneri TaxID=135651 RepID=G0NE04_CAEBE|nr:hypothetical protein CAEBREN_24307 [Caenorhabditis brenneri]